MGGESFGDHGIGELARRPQFLVHGFDFVRERIPQVIPQDGVLPVEYVCAADFIGVFKVVIEDELTFVVAYCYFLTIPAPQFFYSHTEQKEQEGVRNGGNGSSLRGLATSDRSSHV